MRLLVVDDDSNFRRSLVIGFEGMGYRVFEAKSGMIALEFLRSNQESENKVDAVVVDARMPGLDGFWLADQLSIMYPSLQVLILSAYPYSEKLDRYTVLMKPIQISTLAEVIEQKVHSSSEK